MQENDYAGRDHHENLSGPSAPELIQEAYQAQQILNNL